MLQLRLSNQAGRPIAAEHGDLGALLPNYAIGLAVASLLAYLLVGRTARRGPSPQDWGEPRREPRPSALATVLAVLLVVAAGAVATGWTYRVGDSGARAVWEDTIANTKTP
jgi:hypothetical protein